MLLHLIKERRKIDISDIKLKISEMDIFIPPKEFLVDKENHKNNLILKGLENSILPLKVQFGTRTHRDLISH